MIRRGGRADVRFLRDMLHHAFYWRWGTPEAEEMPAYRYVDGWGRPGDAGVIALDEGFPVGAAWYRLFRPSAAGLRVRRRADAGARDRGRARAAAAAASATQLLDALLERARAEGYTTLSLSVERENPALRLYERVRLPPGRGARRHARDDGRPA